MALRSVFQHVVKSSNSTLSVLAARDYSTKFVNQVTLLGRVGRQPAKVGENEAVAFPFYTENVTKLADGTYKTYPQWHRVLIGKRNLAQQVFEVVETGQRLYISGRIVYRAPEVNESGKLVNNHQAVIVADRVTFLEKSRRQENEKESKESSQDLKTLDAVAKEA